MFVSKVALQCLIYKLTVVRMFSMSALMYFRTVRYALWRLEWRRNSSTPAWRRSQVRFISLNSASTGLQQNCLCVSTVRFPSSPSVHFRRVRWKPVGVSSCWHWAGTSWLDMVLGQMIWKHILEAGRVKGGQFL